ncbi:MAG: hypothetical protein IMHGJWDQ_000710 [Candidatus Fervidibacter sp.]
MSAVTEQKVIVYPESDGKPLAENTLQAQYIVYLFEAMAWTETAPFEADERVGKSVVASLLAKLCDYAQLVKVKLSMLVLVTVAVGYLLALRNSLTEVWGHFALTLLGAFGVITAANAFNQVWERETDAVMRRTMNRPLPAKRMSLTEALLVATGAGIGGLAILASVTNWLTTALAAIALWLYVFAYTPLKSKTEFCTLIGAISGALPPVLGWAAVRSEIAPEALLLFALQFLWQFPHFWAIGWLYRDDYQCAGLRLLPVKGDGEAVGRQAFLYTFAVVTVSLLPLWKGWVPPVYLLGALGLGIWFLLAAYQFATRLTFRTAKRLLVAADAYLPLLLVWWLIVR